MWAMRLNLCSFIVRIPAATHSSRINYCFWQKLNSPRKTYSVGIGQVSRKMEYLTFNNGAKMPAVGLGLFLANEPKELEDAINVALEVGYRHFDGAYFYKNENVLGKVIKEWIDSGKIKREDLFITSKLPFHGNHPDRVEHFLKLSLKALQLDYVDLYLIHAPIGVKYFSDEFKPTDENGESALDLSTDLEAVWKGMEAQVEAGRAKSIGVSNFNIAQLERILKSSKIPPANQQVEVNLDFQQNELREFCKKHNVTVTAYGPLGSPGRTTFYASMGVTHFQAPTIMDDPVVGGIAQKYSKTPSQILIRFLVQLGLAPIPKSTNPTRLKQNFDVFNFKLSAEDMNTLKGLDKGEAGRSFRMSVFKGIEKHPEFPFPRK